jgi:hypothetical protein
LLYYCSGKSDPLFKGLPPFSVLNPIRIQILTGPGSALTNVTGLGIPSNGRGSETLAKDTGKVDSAAIIKPEEEGQNTPNDPPATGNCFEVTGDRRSTGSNKLSRRKTI